MADPVIEPTPSPAPPAEQSPSAPAPVAPTVPTQEVKVYDAEYVKALRDESANYRVRARELETKHLEATAQIERLQTTSRNAALKAAVAASPHKVASIDDALILMDKTAITFDEKTGEPQGVDAVLKALLEAKPYLSGQIQNQANPTNPGRAEARVTRDQLAQMTAGQIMNLNLTTEELAALMV